MKMPNKIAAVFLLLVFAFSTPAVSEMVKISNLLSHFHKHQTEDFISFVDFLKVHYAGEDGNDADSDEDRDLPFLSGAVNGLTPCSIAEPPQVVQNFSILPAIHQVNPENYYLSDPHLSMIWQPPRRC